MTTEEYVMELRSYLPYSYFSLETDEYIEYVANACIDNAGKRKYQFSLLAFHLLYMCFVYKTIFQAKGCNLPNLERALEEHSRNLFPFESPFRLSVIPEKKTLELLRCHGFHANKTKEFAGAIEIRDNCAHASGIIQYKEESKFLDLLSKTLEYVKEIQDKEKELLNSSFEDYFKSNYSPKGDSLFPSGFESVNRFIKDKMLSPKDLEYIATRNYSFLKVQSLNPEIIYKKVFYLLIIGKMESEGILLPFRVLEKMPLLENGLNKQDKINLEDLMQQELSDIAALVKH